jgi:ubiquinone/menaquinone biosynthesis C-methylase UbiE
MSSMHERRFNGGIERLRDPERVARLEVSRVVDLALEGLPAKSVLDVGTGTGLFAERFTRQGLRVSGVDANPEMIPAAQGFVPGGSFKLGTAEALPFSDGEIDLVFLGLVLHETDDPLKAFQEARRVARLRVVVLEWPYVEAEFGPPLTHRLPVEKVLEMGNLAGLISNSYLHLQHLVLYRFDVPQAG